MTAPTEPSIVVACAADEAFAMPLAVLGRSMLHHLRLSRHLDLYVLDFGITQRTKERLTCSWPSERLDIHWLSADAESLSYLPIWGRMSIATYQRLLLGRLLPDRISRVIWLDCDVVATTDLTPLWETQLESNTIAAVQDMAVPYFASRFGVGAHRELGLPADSQHFNAGVMVVDLEAWRTGQVAERSFEYLERHFHDVWFWDQEALNVVLLGKWKPLDQRWNQIASLAGRWFFRPEHLDGEVYARIVQSPWLVHWAGTIKPWKCLSRRAAHRKWYEYLDQTDWRGWRPPRTLSSLALGLYDTWGRNLMYPFERWALTSQRSWTLKAVVHRNNSRHA
jgi:lipopolysaccharide biosynthesis glycosyltransferase